MTDILLQNKYQENPVINISDIVYIGLSQEGLNGLWVIFSIFTFLTCIHTVSFMRTISRSSGLPIFASATSLSLGIIFSFNYFTMASNLGWTEIRHEFNHGKMDEVGTTLEIRQIFYSKYITWFLGWPILLHLHELAGFEINQIDIKFGSDLLYNLIFIWRSRIFWVIGLLIGSLISSNHKWGYFTFSALSSILGTIALLNHHSLKLETSRLHLYAIIFDEICNYLYFICWSLTDGNNIIYPDKAILFFGILDICVFGVVPGIVSYTLLFKSSPIHFKFFRKYYKNNDIEMRRRYSEYIDDDLAMINTQNIQIPPPAQFTTI